MTDRNDLTECTCNCDNGYPCDVHRNDLTPRLTEGPNGFAWGPVEVRRSMSIDGRVALTISTDAGQAIEVYVSRTGRSLRVFGKSGEWR
jgi:hypothetical protein